jgi:hypothetical protein
MRQRSTQLGTASMKVQTSVMPLASFSFATMEGYMISVMTSPTHWILALIRRRGLRLREDGGGFGGGRAGVGRREARREERRGLTIGTSAFGAVGPGAIGSHLGPSGLRKTD